MVGVSVVITWMCRLCGKRVEGLAVEELKAFDDAHECRVADVIGLAVQILRKQDSPVMDAVAAWMEGEQRQASHMIAPDDFGVCDEPGSTESALAVAHAVIAQEDL